MRDIEYGAMRDCMLSGNKIATVELKIKQMLETIGISRLLKEKEISKILSSIFSSLEFVRVDIDTIEEKKLKSNDVRFFIYSIDSEYPTRIEVMFQQKNNTEEREQYIAREMSKILTCRTIVGFQEDYSKSPYLSLVFENGKVFLADDLETKYAGDGKNEVKIIKELNYEMNWEFDNSGNKIDKEDPEAVRQKKPK